MTRKDYFEMSPDELRRVAVEEHLDQMLMTYEDVFRDNSKTRKIIVMRELDYTDPFQKEIGETWVKGD